MGSSGIPATASGLSPTAAGPSPTASPAWQGLPFATPRTRAPEVAFQTSSTAKPSSAQVIHEVTHDAAAEQHFKPRDDVKCFMVELANGEKGVVVERGSDGKR